MAPVPTGVIRKFAIVEIPVILNDVPTILANVVIPVTFSCCEVRLVALVTPNVEIPETVRVETIPTLRELIPVTFIFLAVNSSNTKSSATYKSPPTYRFPLKVPTPTKVETPDT